MSDFWKKIFAVAMISGMGLGLAACETAEGFGQDMENAGEAIQDFWINSITRKQLKPK